MVKHTQTIRRQFANELFECDNFVKLVLKGLKSQQINKCNESKTVKQKCNTLGILSKVLKSRSYAK